MAVLLTLLLAAGTVDAAPGRKASQPGHRAMHFRGPVTLVPSHHAPLSVAGLHRYFGTLRVAPESDGIVAVDRLSLERYLYGLEEVPSSWPHAALEAQAVAARTYALYTLSRPPSGVAATHGFDICATTACQVFSGADVVTSPGGARWASAVRRTTGRAVLSRGQPILARYHSTSGGRTLDNSIAFPGEPDYPYLRSVPSRAEKASPLYRWRVRFDTDLLTRILVRNGTWSRGDGRLTRVRSRPVPGSPYPLVILRSERRRLVMPAEQLRSIVGQYAPQLKPRRYPSPARTSSGRLPETLPSTRVDIVTRGDVVEVTGRGWGHGVGMSQWGARGLALKGLGYEGILHHYYLHTKVAWVREPERVDVGLAWGLRSLSVAGSFRLTGDERTLQAGPGVYSIRFDGPGRLTVRKVHASAPLQRAHLPAASGTGGSSGHVPLWVWCLVLAFLAGGVIFATTRRRAA